VLETASDSEKSFLLPLPCDKYLTSVQGGYHP
jgi:hypothetical protein